MALLLLLATTLYELPGAPLPEPAPEVRLRVEAALVRLRQGREEEVERAVRELAFAGEPALGLVLKRLNEAGPGERLLLLVSMSRVPRAAPLLERARSDPSAPVRAWFAPLVTEPTPPLKELAARYIKFLSIAEKEKLQDHRVDYEEYIRKLRELTDEELKVAIEELSNALLLQDHLPRMRDPAFAELVRARRKEAALEFAKRGARALRTGELAPYRGDPLFVTYLALLREKGNAFHTAVVALIALGPEIDLALAGLLGQETHEPRVILRLRSAVRADRGRGLYGDLSVYRPEVQRALLDLAPEILDPQEGIVAGEWGTRSGDAGVRSYALALLASYPAPAGVASARALLDPEREDLRSPDFIAAAQLLARAGLAEDLARLATLAEIQVPQADTACARRLSSLRVAAVRGLRGFEGVGREQLAERYFASESPILRGLGVQLARDRAGLERRLAEAEDAALMRVLAQRLLEVHGLDAAAAVLDALRRLGPSQRVVLLQRLRRLDAVEAFVELAEDDDPALQQKALGHLLSFEQLDARFEERLLRVHDGVSKELRPYALGALLPLGTPEARKRLQASGADLFDTLVARAREDLPIPFPFALDAYLADADAARLEALLTVAEVMPEVTPGFYAKLLAAWEGVPKDAEEPHVVRSRIFDALAASNDKLSAAGLFARVRAGQELEPDQLDGTMMAASALLSSEDLLALLPRLREAAEALHPLQDKEVPPPDLNSERLLLRGLNALSWARVEGALPLMCDFVLDPALQPSAFKDHEGSDLPRWALDALRHFPPQRVDAVFRKALQRAEAGGTLAALEPDYLLELLKHGYRGGWRGRRLYEVMLALCAVLERLPYEADYLYYKMRAVASGYRRYKQAAALCRAHAERSSRLGRAEDEGHFSPRRMRVWAQLYDARAAKDEAALRRAFEQAGGDPFLLNVGAWGLSSDRMALDLADAQSGEAVRLTGGLNVVIRDTLAALRLKRGRPEEALALLDPEQRLPVERPDWSGWLPLHEAVARATLGQDDKVAYLLDTALERDRRLIAWARAQPSLQRFGAVFDEVELNFFRVLFGRQ
ncbi:MAG: hypothetical protein O7C98_13445 [Planctomycetota bacterium]|nr:hypothetical protein [Planctomycetota bacterium]